MWLLVSWAVLATIATVYLGWRWRLSYLDAQFALALVDAARSETMAAEARARGVGGRAEHGGAVVTYTGILSPFMVEAMRIVTEGKGKDYAN